MWRVEESLVVWQWNEANNTLPYPQVDRVEEVEPLSRGAQVGVGQALVYRQVVHLVHYQAAELSLPPGDDPIKFLSQDVGTEVLYSSIDNIRLVGCNSLGPEDIYKL